MKVKHGRETITTKIAYIAGFFDGEGCIRIKKANQKGHSYYLWVAITNSNKQILEEVMELFGGKVRLAERSVNKRIYHYLITASEAYDFLMILTPFLKEKKAQAQFAMTFHRRKGKMLPESRRIDYEKMMRMKREIIGNLYENPELLTS